MQSFLNGFGILGLQKYERSARLDDAGVSQIETERAAEKQRRCDKIVADRAAAESIASHK